MWHCTRRSETGRVALAMAGPLIAPVLVCPWEQHPTVDDFDLSVFLTLGRVKTSLLGSVHESALSVAT